MVLFVVGSDVVRLFQTKKFYLIPEEVCLRGFQWGIISEKITYQCIKKVTDLVFQSVSSNYQFIIVEDKQYISKILPESVPDESNFKQYLNTYDISLIMAGEETDLSKLFYYLALDANKLGEVEATGKYLMTAALLSPELSYYHNEFANFLLHKGESVSAEKEMEYCYRFEFPRRDCKRYHQSILLGEAYEVGFLKDSVDTYYSNK